MKLRIGETIKRMRAERGITQEELAEMIGVSAQSVCRWENGACYPDMELLPTLADFFGITTDTLLGASGAVEAKKTEKYMSEFQTAISRGEIDECIRIARAGVSEFPNNYALLNKLMYALFAAGDSDGNIADASANAEKYDAEITSIGERIAKYCPDQDIRLEATARLAFNHCEMGRRAIGRKLYETLPPREYCRELQIWYALDEDERLPFLHSRIKEEYDSLCTFIRLLGTSGCLDGKRAVDALEKILELENIVWDGHEPADTFMRSYLAFDIAKGYACIGDAASASSYLRLAAESAKSFDSRPDEVHASSLLFGDMAEKKTDFDTTDTRPLCEIMREKWLSAPVFDGLRGTPEMRSIIDMM